MTKQARWQRQHHARGLCITCSEPAVDGWRCLRHRLSNRDRNRVYAARRRARRREEARRAMLPPIRPLGV